MSAGKRYLTYKVTTQSSAGHTAEDKIEVVASTINAGFRRATDIALRGLPKGWEIVSVEFWIAS